LTAFGEAPMGRTLSRATAQAGDIVYVSGAIGDGMLGLKVLRGGLPELSEDDRAYLATRYRLPEPRVELGRRLAEDGLASAALDVSDGLAADLGHIAEESGLAAEIEAAAVPLSPAARRLIESAPERLPELLGGGDDYELLFTVAPGRAEEVAALAVTLDLPLTAVGRMAAGQGLRVTDSAGREVTLKGAGWRHF
jgi:thiamine-monophosphate kinase